MLPCTELARVVLNSSVLGRYRPQEWEKIIFWIFFLHRQVELAELALGRPNRGAEVAKAPRAPPIQEAPPVVVARVTYDLRTQFSDPPLPRGRSGSLVAIGLHPIRPL